MTTGIEMIAAERKRQIEEEGFTAEHDDKHVDGSIAQAAAYYAACMAPWPKWPNSWLRSWCKNWKHDRFKQLAIAGALIAAEIDRLQRMETKKD